MTPRRLISQLLLLVIALLFLLPLIYALATSLKPANEVFTEKPT